MCACVNNAGIVLFINEIMLDSILKTNARLASSTLPVTLGASAAPPRPGFKHWTVARVSLARPIGEDGGVLIARGLGASPFPFTNSGRAAEHIPPPTASSQQPPAARHPRFACFLKPLPVLRLHHTLVHLPSSHVDPPSDNAIPPASPQWLPSNRTPRSPPPTSSPPTRPTSTDENAAAPCR